MSIGRVLVQETYRRKGIADKMLKLAIEYITTELGESEIQIGAQAYLLDFYKSLGFVENSEVYLEDGIPHLDMIRRA